MNNAKGLLESKTFWFGAAQIVFGCVGMAFGWLDQTTGSALIVTGLGSIGFRMNTSAPISGMISK